MTSLFGVDQLRVVSVGIGGLASGDGATVLDWRPPLDGDPNTLRILADSFADPSIDQANEEAVRRALAVEPTLIGVAPASRVIDALAAGNHRLLHAGPPIDWAAMCGPMRGALVGAVLLEGWAESHAEAEAQLNAGAIALEPCHHHGAVGPMAGVISPSMPLWQVTDAATGETRAAGLNEGLGAVLRFGANSNDVIDQLRWMTNVVGPTLNAAVQQLDGFDLLPLMAQALHMGDELHNRNVAATGQLVKRLAPAICATTDSKTAASVLAFLGGNDHTFLNISMATAKLTMDAAHGVAGSTIVTAMARNGVEFGIRVSGRGERWFTATAPVVNGLFFSGYGPSDAAADLGDSAITETAGLGGFAMASAPAIVRFVGGSPSDALGHSIRMRDITVARHPAFTIPMLDFSPTAFGIDVRAVVDTGIVPIINTGIAHRDAGVGQIGAGITGAPWDCFRAALGA